MRKLCSLFWLACSLVLGACAESPHVEDLDQDLAVAAPALRIMPLGDSITYGVGSSTTSSYRAALWDRLVGNSVDFVGTQRSGQLPDTDHQGHSGWTIAQIAGIADATLVTHRPNVVTLHIGTNDMNRNIEVAQAPARLGALIDQILVAAPDATVLVATLVPANNATVQARVAEYNRQIPSVVAQRANAGKHVRLVSMAAVTTADLADTLHPNDAGYRKMSDAFFAGIQAALAAGWIANPVPPGGTCSDVPSGWLSRGRVAAGTGAPSSRVQLADFSGDGRADYLVVADNGAVDAWINNGTSGWTARGRVAGGTGAPGSQVRFADLDGDGRADYLVLASNGAVSAWINNGGDGAGGWSGRGQVATGVGAPDSQIRFADLDGDHRADYLVLADNGSMRAWTNNGAATGGGWIGRGQVASGTGAPATQVRLADFTCDGRVDYLVVASNGAVNAWINNGVGTGGGWVARGQVASGAGPGDQIRFADLDGDGKDDYLVVADNGAINAWTNRGGDAP